MVDIKDTKTRIYFAFPGVRYVGGSEQENEGKIEVFLNQTWYPICRESFNIEAANVACREMGYVEALGITNAFRTEELSSHVLTSLKCEGSEQRLRECKYEIKTTEICVDKLFAGVMCRQGKEKSIWQTKK